MTYLNEKATEIRGEPTVVNIHKAKGVRPSFTKYIGRATQYTEFTEDSKWHNPFTVKRWGHVRTLPMFEHYARALLAREWPENRDGFEHFSRDERDEISRAFYRSLKRWGTWDIDDLTGQACGCWCVDDDGSKKLPETCHGQVWRKIWRETHHG